MRILVAEDNQKLARLLKRGLEAERYAVDIVHDGSEALALADGKEYDLLIFDRMMPGKEGIEVVQELRRQGVVTPVLLLTAKDGVRDKVDGLDAGADDYLVKPFAFDELLARVRSLFRRNGESKDSVLELESLKLDPAQKRVWRFGNLIHLTAREYSLLEFLLRHKENVVSQTQIIDHVWDGEYDGLSNIVQTYIKQLRQKIDKPFAGKSPLIQTVRGLGYRLGE